MGSGRVAYFSGLLEGIGEEGGTHARHDLRHLHEVDGDVGGTSRGGRMRQVRGRRRAPE
jgi:hypothetical protein